MSMLLEKKEDEVGVHIGVDPLTFCLENHNNIANTAYIGNAMIKVNDVAFVKDAP